MTESDEDEISVMEYSALNRIPSGVGVYDVTGKLIEMKYLNDGYFQMIGVDRDNRESYVGDRALSVIHPDDRAKILDEAKASIKDNRMFQLRFRVLDGNGIYIWIGIRANHESISRETERFYASYYNVDTYISRQTLLENQKKDLSSVHSALEKEKQKNDNLLKKILSTTQTAIFWKDANRRFLGVNQAFLDYYGFPDDSVLLGKTDEDMGWHSDPDPYKNDELQVITTGKSTYRVHGKCFAKGENRDIVASKSPLYIDGKIAGIVGSFDDVTTEYKQSRQIEKLNAKLKQKLDAEQRLKEKAQSANDAKTEFLSRVSHDMRTPLNVILGMSRIAAEQDNPDVTRDCLSKIDASSKFLLGLINDVLDMAQAEKGLVEIKEEPYQYEDFINYVDSIIKPLCTDKNIKLIIDAPKIDGYIPVIDKLHFNQILFNILSNAAKFTPECGTVTLRMIEKLTFEGKIDITIIISDTGIGMSDEFQKNLFQPFTQEIRDDVDLTRGTGLGLAISKKLADLMHSTLTINSKLNYGTTVTIHGIFDCIPYEKYDTGALKHLPREHSRLAGTRILICEDHPLNQEIVRILLSKQKIDVDIAENGKLGVEMFEKSREGYYQAILMDIRMPVMDGYIATRSIRNLNRRDATRIPILAMSADVFTDDIKKCLSNGMNGHIAKPIDPETMYNVIEECMGQNMKNAQ